jgi:hypothetical protein
MLNLVVDASLLGLAAAVRVVTVNRLVKRKLLLTLTAAAISLVGSAFGVAGTVPVDLAADVGGIASLLTALRFGRTGFRVGFRILCRTRSLSGCS